MAILVDTPIWPFRGRLWCHLVSDTSYDELHAIAEALGIPRRGFQGDHYDLPEEMRDAAIALGAQPGDQLAAGLRPPPPAPPLEDPLDASTPDTPHEWCVGVQRIRARPP